jgi:hypothetical protein
MLCNVCLHICLGSSFHHMPTGTCDSRRAVTRPLLAGMYDCFDNGICYDISGSTSEYTLCSLGSNCLRTSSFITDKYNCGGCGNECSPGRICDGSKCVCPSASECTTLSSGWVGWGWRWGRAGLGGHHSEWEGPGVRPPHPTPPPPHPTLSHSPTHKKNTTHTWSSDLWPKIVYRKALLASCANH